MAKAVESNGVIDVQKYKKHSDKIKACKVKVQEQSENMSELCRSAKEDGVHIQALRLVHKLKRKDPQDVRAYLDAISSYAHIEGLLAQDDMFADADKTAAAA